MDQLPKQQILLTLYELYKFIYCTTTILVLALYKPTCPVNW